MNFLNICETHTHREKKEPVFLVGSKSVGKDKIWQEDKFSQEEKKKIKIKKKVNIWTTLINKKEANILYPQESCPNTETPVGGEWGEICIF